MKIELNHVSKVFGRVAALADLSFEVASGSRVALVGPNGSGKSTLTRVLMGMSSYSGEVRIDGLSPRRDRAVLAPLMAYMPQTAPSLGASCAEVVKAVSEVRGLKAGRIADVAAALNLDWAMVRGLSFRALSGGMKQKLLLAMTLTSGASLFILDEPTASLDPGAREAFFNLFKALDGRATLLLCSHRLEELRVLVDQALVLQEGRLAYQGPAAPLLIPPDETGQEDPGRLQIQWGRIRRPADAA